MQNIFLWEKAFFISKYKTARSSAKAEERAMYCAQPFIPSPRRQ